VAMERTLIPIAARRSSSWSRLSVSMT
jgi:hypothetical protein